jgi:2-haloacid dehalogenase
MIEFEQFTHLTFDCYGTIIDWETGILSAVQPVLERHGVSIGDSDLLGLYAQLEAEQEAGPYKPYKQVLMGVMEGFGADLGFTPSESDLLTLPGSVGSWPPFPDSVEALHRLQVDFQLVILSNIDDELFAATEEALGIQFDEVITAQQVGNYKPSLENFEVALDRLQVGRQQVLHVAQSLFHDHLPAKQLGFTTVWVNRPSRCPGVGVTLPTRGSPGLEPPDIEIADLESLVKLLGV